MLDDGGWWMVYLVSHGSHAELRECHFAWSWFELQSITIDES